MHRRRRIREVRPPPNDGGVSGLDDPVPFETDVAALIGRDVRLVSEHLPFALSPARLQAVNRSISLRLVLALSVIASASGCVQEPAKPFGGGRVVRSGDSASPGSVNLPPGPTPPNAVEATDPVASRLHDLSGLLLEYYLINKRMPAGLDELKVLADPTQPTDFVDPRTGQPFVYLPQAARMTSGDTRLVVYAPSPDSQGVYQGVLMRLARGSQVTATWVVSLTEIELQGQLGGAPVPSPASSR